MDLERAYFVMALPCFLIMCITIWCVMKLLARSDSSLSLSMLGAKVTIQTHQRNVCSKSDTCPNYVHAHKRGLNDD